MLQEMQVLQITNLKKSIQLLMLPSLKKIRFGHFDRFKKKIALFYRKGLCNT